MPTCRRWNLGDSIEIRIRDNGTGTAPSRSPGPNPRSTADRGFEKYQEAFK
jgi:hypothetical protein